MARKSRWQIALEYGAFRVLHTAVRALSPAAALGAADALGALAYRLDGRHRRVALDNLRAAYGAALPAPARARLLRRVYRNFLATLFELMLADRVLRPDNWRRVVSLEFHPATRAYLATGRPAVFFSGHLGNWEMLGAVLVWEGLAFHAVARPLDNPRLDRLLVAQRQRAGATVVPKEGALRRLVAALKDGHHVMLLVDQAAGSDGASVEFFGRPASTTRSAAALAYRFGLPMIPACTFRRGRRFRHHVRFLAPLVPDPARAKDAEIERLTVEMTRAVERMVRTVPDQWLWLHNRWKRPGVAPAAPGARDCR